jgi:hypothetical protein
MFATEPNLELYTVLTTDPRVFDQPAPALPGQKQPRRRRIWQTLTIARKSVRALPVSSPLTPPTAQRCPDSNNESTLDGRFSTAFVGKWTFFQQARHLSALKVHPTCLE